MKSVFRELLAAARCDKTVLILGETGTGKDLIARKIHDLSARRKGPFVPINCANLPEGLFESELFGHVRGAFTGAVTEKAGILDEASYGTVFMDEIGELSSPVQAKILRLLDKRESRKIGANQPHFINVRFIFATNQNLIKNVRMGSFREDLFFRINILSIHIPPLRERREDIPRLATCFLDRENCRMGTCKIMPPETMKRLSSYSFPGNVRELENIVERSMAVSDHSAISPNDIRFDYDDDRSDIIDMGKRLERALERCHWNKTRAAVMLGKSRRQLYRIMQRHKIGDLLSKIILTY